MDKPETLYLARVRLAHFPVTLRKHVFQTWRIGDDQTVMQRIRDVGAAGLLLVTFIRFRVLPHGTSGRFMVEIAERDWTNDCGTLRTFTSFDVAVDAAERHIDSLN